MLQEGSSQHHDRSSGEGGANNDSNSRSASRQRANRRYDLTGETGSYRYMAPEVFRHEPYNSKARFCTVFRQPAQLKYAHSTQDRP